MGRLGRELEAARERTGAAATERLTRLERLETEVAQVESERDTVWEELRADSLVSLPLIRGWGWGRGPAKGAWVRTARGCPP
jgi:hypothetical protein